MDLSRSRTRRGSISATPARPGRGRAGRGQPGATRRGGQRVRAARRLQRRTALRTRDLRGRAQARLRRFRKGSILAVAMAGMLLILLSGADPQAAADEAGSPEGVERAEQAGDASGEAASAEAAPLEPASGDPARSVEEAATTIRDLAVSAYGLLPKLLIALVIIVLALVLARVVRMVLARVLRSWERVEAISALSGIAIFLLALGAALSVIAGDARALVGSVGLTGLALSWALQAPIESFTGWLMNSFRGYYRVGDRISVGEVFGDVYKIDILTTTVWESGGEGKPVRGAQPTGALITFPNSEVLRANITNYTQDFPYVWDEVVVSVTNESDLAYAARVVQGVAERLLGTQMEGPAQEYRRLLDASGLAYEVSREPSVFVSPAESWTDITVRYLVPARERRRWSSELVVATSAEIARPEHAGRIVGAYPRANVALLGGARPGARPEGGQPGR